ncbi:hypothetical protein [Streptomyces sp. NPDC005408]|uniref:hypothetical protein n=1 Tax=Streptomyces sp. NPDC005408 TaxID=3155341 RepID=UPI0033A97190
MRAADEIDQDEFIEQRDEFVHEIAEAEAKLKRSTARKVPTIPKREIFNGLMAEWPHMDDDTKRAALRKVIWRVTASRGHFHDRSRYKIIPLWERPETA